MDKTLVKILNMATSGSFEESNNAIEQAYRYMKRTGKKLEDIEFNSLYNGDVVAIKMIARFSHEHDFHKDQGEFINTWTNNIYGKAPSGTSQQARHEIMVRDRQNQKLQRELNAVKGELRQTRVRLEEEQKSVEKYLGIIKEKHAGLLEALEESQEKARNDSSRAQQRIRVLESELKQLKAKNSEVNELYEYMMHAKELQINNIKKELKTLLGNLRFSALKPLVSY